MKREVFTGSESPPSVSHTMSNFACLQRIAKPRTQLTASQPAQPLTESSIKKTNREAPRYEFKNSRRFTPHSPSATSLLAGEDTVTRGPEYGGQFTKHEVCDVL